jgi:hypothetical protein
MGRAGKQALTEHVVPGLMSWLGTLDTGEPLRE